MINSNQKIDLIMFNMSSFFDWDYGASANKRHFFDRFFDWSGGKINRNYHILHGLAQDQRIGRIISVDFLPVGLRQALAHYLKNILFEIKDAEMLYGDLTSACYQRSEKIYVYSTIDSLFSFKTVVKELRRIEKILNFKNIVFWSYNPMFIEYIGKLNEKLLIFDTVDNLTEHPSYTKLISRNQLLANYKIISEKANLIFTVSSALKGFYNNLGRSNDIYWVPNGADYDHFNQPEKIGAANELDRFNQPIIGYLGTIQERFDFDLIVDISKQHPDKIVALCGPVWPSVKNELLKIKNLPNIRLFGRVNYADAPSYINKFNVAIIPHKISKFTDSMNPIKLYEYLACGKPVVSTKIAGFDLFKHLIYAADNNCEFIKSINDALRHDSSEKQNERRSAVKNHSWQKRSAEMANLMFQKLGIGN